MSYIPESKELEATILEIIVAWHETGQGLTDAAFNTLALRIFAHQLRYNIPYAKYCASFGITEFTLPVSWDHIPAVPAAAYKEATLATFDTTRAALAFETSGTTQGLGGKHYMEANTLYDAALLATFDRLVLQTNADNARSGQFTPFRYFNLVPNPIDRPQSSLGYMMAQISTDRGDGRTGWYVRANELFLDSLIADIERARTDNVPMFLAGTAFAFVQLSDTLAERNLTLPLSMGSLVMETGGFKGRSRIVSREDLYTAIAECFAIDEHSIFAEYGMTELTSQRYDTLPTHRQSLDSGREAPYARDDSRVKVAPPWLRARVVGPDGKRLPKGVVGALAHVDLANRSSCIAIQTEDLGAEMDGGIILLGREQGAALRGCSLDAESLQATTRH